MLNYTNFEQYSDNTDELFEDIKDEEEEFCVTVEMNNGIYKIFYSPLEKNTVTISEKIISLDNFNEENQNIVFMEKSYKELLCEK